MSDLPSSEDIEALTEKFNEADLNENGQLSVKEFKEFLSQQGFGDKKTNKSILRSSDLDNDKQIGIEEFIEFIEKYEDVMDAVNEESDKYQEMFNEIDEDGDELVTSSEVEAYWDSQDMDKDFFKVLKYSFRIGDEDSINFEEFNRLMAIAEMRKNSKAGKRERKHKHGKKKRGRKGKHGSRSRSGSRSGTGTEEDEAE